MMSQKGFTMKQLFKRDNALRFVNYNEFTSFLCKPLGSEHYTFGIKCPSEDEETILEQIAVSHVGNPNTNGGLVMPGYTSKDEIYTLMDSLRDLTLHINKTYLMSNDLKKEIWQIANDYGKSNIMVTCYGSLLSYRTTDRDKAKSIVINISTLADMNLDIESIRAAIYNDYGHLMKPFMKQFFENKDLLKDWYDKSLESLLHGVPQSDPYANIIGRQANYFATSEVAGILLENVYRDIGIEHSNPTKVVYGIWKDFIANDWAVRIN